MIVRNIGSFTTKELYFETIKTFQSQFKAKKIILVRYGNFVIIPML